MRLCSSPSSSTSTPSALSRFFFPFTILPPSFLPFLRYCLPSILFLLLFIFPLTHVTPHLAVKEKFEVCLRERLSVFLRHFFRFSVAHGFFFSRRKGKIAVLRTGNWLGKNQKTFISSQRTGMSYLPPSLSSLSFLSLVQFKDLACLIQAF